MKALVTVMVLLLLTACATMTPEAKLKKGYDTATAVVTSTGVLLDRHQISSSQAERVYNVSGIAQTSLDAGRDELETCRALGKKDCGTAVTNIDMGAGLLLELEKFLEAQQVEKGP